MKERLILLIIIAIFVVHALSLNFTQDDAFISYRYVRNFIYGHGLVFNSGERVEGYTNFFWIIILSIFAQLGLDVIIVSKVLGVAAGAATLFLAYQISRNFFRRGVSFFSLFVPLLLACNSAFAYWSISGLETVFFVMAVLLSVYFYFTHERLTIISCALSSLIRPEGVLVFAIFILHKFFFKKVSLKDCLWYILGFTLLLLPFLIFKIYYYGELLPNPFYAKTGFSFEYVKSGLEYSWLFLKHYCLWGILYLLPLLSYKSLDLKRKLLLMIIYVYSLYVMLIGGDVLKVHRFFLPVLPFLCLLFVTFIERFSYKFKSSVVRNFVPPLLMILVLVFFFFMPFKWILQTRKDERRLVVKMENLANHIKDHFGENSTVAISTIGSISYHLGLNVKVIDVLGLTDKYIARHPEEIKGIAATWKEKKYNTGYLLSLDPDFIIFSTDIKPSAPAERALLLNSKFRQNYYMIHFPAGPHDWYSVFKRKGAFSKKNQVFKDVQFVNLFNEAVYLANRKRHQASLEKLKEVTSVCPEDFVLVYQLMGFLYYYLKDYKKSEECAKKAIKMDDYSVLSHYILAEIYHKNGRTAEAQKQIEKIQELNPGFFREQH